MNNNEIKKWEEKRREGKKTYILKYHILPTTLFFIIIFIAPNIYRFFAYENYTLEKLNSFENGIIFLICIISGSIIGFVLGIFAWHVNENQYWENKATKETKINILNL